MKIKFLCIILLTLLVTSCKNKNVFFQYQQVDTVNGWAKDSTYTYTVDIKDTQSAYNVYIHIRNTPDYPNQNLWLFISETQDSVQVNDTIEFYLADVRGKWLGSGASALKEMPVLYKQNIHFTDTLCAFHIKHGMREDLLKGINDIGLRVEKVE